MKHRCRRTDVGPRCRRDPARVQRGDAALGPVLDGVRGSSPDLAILVIDDRSRDGTATVARAHGVEWCRTRATSGTAPPCRPAARGRRGPGTATWLRWTPTANTIPPTWSTCSRRCAAARPPTSSSARASSRRAAITWALRTAGREFFQRLLGACGGPPSRTRRRGSRR
jgi:hypothetical protein